VKKNFLDRLAVNDNPPSFSHRKGVRSATIMAWLFIIPSLIFLTICIWRPIFISVFYSLFKMKGYTPVKFVGMDNYIKVLTDTNFIKAFLNTLQYVFWELLLAFIPPIIVAIMLNEIRGGHKTLKFAIYFPVIVPGIVTALMWKLMYDPTTAGLLNNIIGRMGVPPQPFLNSTGGAIFWICVSIAWNSLGGNLIYYLSALQGINSEIYEAAAIEGAGIFKRIRHITLPQISSVILLFVIRMIINVFQTMERPLTMTDGGPNNASISMGLQAYRYAFENFKTEYALALGVIQFLILMVITIFYFFLQGRIETE